MVTSALTLLLKCMPQTSIDKNFAHSKCKNFHSLVAFTDTSNSYKQYLAIPLKYFYQPFSSEMELISNSECFSFELHNINPTSK